jgi:hypothetical protein
MLERCLIVATVAMLAGCGSSSSPAAPTPSPVPADPAAPASPAPAAGPALVTISTGGMSPLELTVSIGARVTFVNSDRIAHDILGGFDHLSRDCPEVDVVGFLLPGQRRETASFDQAKTCRFHDHTNVGNAAYQGRIEVR